MHPSARPAARQANIAARAMAFGRVWQSDVALHAFTPLADNGLPPDIRVQQVDHLPERGAPLVSIGNGDLFADGLRLRIRDEVDCHVYAQGDVRWVARPGWTGDLPPEMFSVIAGAMLAMLGDLPVHGSAVELDGRGILLCGPGGAGKSTLAAALCSIGGRLISDDLTILSADAAGAPVMHLGRRSVRLFPKIAAAMPFGETVTGQPIGPRGKQLACPPLVPPDAAVRLHSIVLLEPPALAGALPAGGALETLLNLQFRPAWMRRLPGAAARLAMLDRLAREVRLTRYRTRPIDGAAELTDAAWTVATLALDADRAGG